MYKIYRPQFIDLDYIKFVWCSVLSKSWNCFRIMQNFQTIFWCIPFNV